FNYKGILFIKNKYLLFFPYFQFSYKYYKFALSVVFFLILAGFNGFYTNFLAYAFQLQERAFCHFKPIT
ncbi:hypothetical protein J0A78_13320, partial [Providencia rettgeri]